MRKSTSGLKYDPLYKPKPARKVPTKRKRVWVAFLRILTFGLVGRGRSSEG
jgi:hypothetical protein